MAQNPTASLIIIGNEILSGRTKDTNLNYIAKELGDIGVIFSEVRVIPDIEQKIIDTVNELRNEYDYVFTTGGIGPTHDDITTLSIAKAFGLKLVRSGEIVEKLRLYYEGSNRELNEARLKMADFPEGAEFIDNPISTAPGFKIGNVFVMAGIPNVMQAMFASVKTYLKHGRQILSSEIAAYVGESAIAAPLTALQEKYPDVDMGSYPFVRDKNYGTSIVMRGLDKERLSAAYKEVYAMLAAHGEIITASGSHNNAA
jgi:molybdenum cofactor synthesis domain-containing protein